MRNLLVSLSLFSLISSNGSVDVADPVRLCLEASSAFWFSWVKYAGYAVAVGCLMEAPETFVTLKRWWLLKFRDADREETKEDKKRWIAPLAAVGLIVIVVGIVIETYAEGKVSDVDALLRAHESDKITAAEVDAVSAIHEAGSAKDSARDAGTAAGTAKSVADAVAKDAQTISALLKSVTPRGHLIDASKESIARTLSPFSGQKVAVEQCGRNSQVPQPPILDRDTLEKTGTWAAIANTIRDMTEWSVSAYNLPDCGLESGVRVFANSAASSRTKRAAKVLSEELERVLPAQPNTTLLFVPSSLTLGQRADMPLALIAKDPELIVVAVGNWPIPWGLPEMGRFANKRHQSGTPTRKK
jgi:hypothetical protein